MIGEGPQPEVEKNKFTTEDITSAKDVGSTLEAYRRVSENINDYSVQINCQLAVADKMHELGDEEKSSQFTILAEQTRNTARSIMATKEFTQGVKDMGENVNDFQISVKNMVEVGNELNKASSGMQYAGETMESASRRIQSSADR